MFSDKGFKTLNFRALLGMPLKEIGFKTDPWQHEKGKRKLLFLSGS